MEKLIEQSLLLLLGSMPALHAQEPAPGESATPAVAEPLERQGKAFHLVFHAADLPPDVATSLADAAIAQLEAFYPALKALVGGSSGKPRPIHLYRDEAAYRAAEVAAQPFRCQVESFVDKANVGHVLLGPKIAASHFVHVGLPHVARDRLLRTAAEQVVAPLVPSSPMRDWVQHVVVVGAVEAFVNPDHECGRDGAYDERRVSLPWWHEQGFEETFDQLVAHSTLIANRAGWESVMTTSALTAQTLFADNKKGWAKKLLGKHTLPTGKSGELALRHVALESGDRHLAKARRRLAEVWQSSPTLLSREGIWHPSAKRSLLLGVHGLSAVVWTPVTFLPKGDYAWNGTMELVFGDDSYARIMLGRSEQDTLAVSVHEGKTLVSLWDKVQRKYSQKAHGKANIVEGTSFQFRVEVTATELRVLIDGQLSCTWAHGGRNMHTEVSVETEDCLVWLSDVHAEPLPK
jgi:hypothetical protein